MIETAQSEINSEKERALADINNQVSELSVLIASKVLQKKFQNKIKKVSLISILKRQAINNGRCSKNMLKLYLMSL